MVKNNHNTDIAQCWLLILGNNCSVRIETLLYRPFSHIYCPTHTKELLELSRSASSETLVLGALDSELISSFGCSVVNPDLSTEVSCNI